MVVLSGFLGAGKTSLLARLARAGELDGTLVLVNEAGDVSIDGALLRAARAEVVDLSGGAACCLYEDEDDLLAALRTLSEEPRFRRVVLETSGLAHPAGLLGVLQSPTLEPLVRLEGFAVVVDVARASDYLLRYEEARAQIRVADRVAVAKLDLAGSPPAPELAPRLNALLGPLNPDLPAAVSTADDPAVLAQWLWKPRGKPWPSISEAHEHAAVFSVSLVDYAAYDVIRLRDVLDEIRPRLLRVKGFAHARGQRQRAFVEWSGQEVTVTWGSSFGRATPRTELVVIAAGDASTQADLERALRSCREETSA